MGYRLTRNYKKRNQGGLATKLVMAFTAVVALGILLAGGKYFITQWFPDDNHPPAQSYEQDVPPPVDLNGDVSGGVEETSEGLGAENPAKGGLSVSKVQPSRSTSSTVDTAPSTVKPKTKSKTKTPVVQLASPVEETPKSQSSSAKVPKVSPVAKTIKKASSESSQEVNPKKSETVKPLPQNGGGTTPERTNVSASSASASKEASKFMVQVGAFSSLEGAKVLMERLGKDGVKATLQEASVSDKKFFRVRVPVDGDRSKADEEAARLAKMGYPTQVVPPKGDAK
ncbi:MAG: SPOR domain-containing protein [Thermanaerothrix sp.]|nr:SPOR domain-containing protein [Thermanaerothrix sp.]